MSLISLLISSTSIPPKTGDVLVVEGMSIMLGDGGSGVTQGNGITDKLCALKGWTEEQHAVSGTTIDDLLANLSRIPTFNGTTHRNIVYGHCINDVGNKTNTAAQFKAKLLTLLTHIHDVKGWEKRRIYILSGTYATPGNWADYGQDPDATNDDYQAAIAATEDGAAEYGVNHTDLFPWMEANGGAALLDSFGRHPLDTATAAIAAEWETRHTNW